MLLRMADAFDHCEALVREADKDRFLATLFAPATARGALFALYAFNRRAGARARARARADAGRDQAAMVARRARRPAGRGGGGDPVAAALLDTIARYALPPQPLRDLIEARAFDLYDDPMATLAALEAYARKTSSALFGLAAQISAGRASPEEAAGMPASPLRSPICCAVLPVMRRGARSLFRSSCWSVTARAPKT